MTQFACRRLNLTSLILLILSILSLYLPTENLLKENQVDLVFFMKNDLWPYIEVLDDKHENCLRFELNLNPDSKKIITGAVYLPPEGSPYSLTEIFERLEYDILNFTSDNDSNLCLLGDFNARSGILFGNCPRYIVSRLYILPIYKNKGYPQNADNYRGITILSCFGKLSTSI